MTECSQTKAEIAARLEAEDKLKGKGMPVAPGYLSEGQRSIFDNLVRLLKDSEILSELDSAVLAICATALDRIAAIEHLQNIDSEMFGAPKLIAAKEKYTKDFFRCCNELCLSPQSRAKMANMAAAKKEADPLLEALKE